MLERTGCVVTEVKRATFSSKTIEQDLRRLLPSSAESVLAPALEKQLALGAASAVLAYLQLLSDETNFGRFALRSHDLKEFLRLDQAALHALNLFPEMSGSGTSNKFASLFGLLNRCKTAQGVRMLSQWIKQPLVQIHAIENRQTLVGLFFDEADARHRLQDDFLRMMPDMLRMSKRFQRGAATLEDVVRCYQAVVKLPALQEALAEMPVTDANARALFDQTFVAPLQELYTHLAKLVDMVETTIDLDELAYHHFVIKPDFDERLTAIKQDLDRLRDQFDEQHALAGEDLKLDTDKKLHLENHSSYGYCFRVTRTVRGGSHFRTRVSSRTAKDTLILVPSRAACTLPRRSCAR